jgi:hypothetical protein
MSFVEIRGIGATFEPWPDRRRACIGTQAQRTAACPGVRECRLSEGLA